MKKAIYSEKAPKVIGTYSQALKLNQVVYLSGQIALNAETMELCSDEIRLQIEQVIHNLSFVCQEAGGGLDDIVKLTVYLVDLNHFPLVNEAMSRYFSQPYPARCAVGVSALPCGAQVEMDAIMELS